jgi:hypothetical protein
MPLTKILKTQIINKINKNELINYIETGVHEGFSIYQSLEIGFKNIYGIENNLEYVKKVSEKFKNNENVSIIHSDSRNGLKEIFNNKNDNYFVFLDAHGHTIKNDSPVEDEMLFLKSVKDSIKIIIIDDFHQIKKKKGDWQENTGLENLINLSSNFFGEETKLSEVFYYYGGFKKRNKNSYLIISKKNKFKNHNILYRLLNDLYIVLLNTVNPKNKI